VNPESLTTFGEVSSEISDALATSHEPATSNKPRLVGMGIYLEAHATAYYARTNQVLITPTGKTEKGEVVSMAIISRTISTGSPRAQWRVNFVGTSKEVESMSSEDKAIWLASRANEIVSRMFGEQFTPRSRPIVFEMTDVDFTNIGQWKVPASALRRIIKARLEVGYPENLY
jgi:hypothetical protein